MLGVVRNRLRPPRATPGVVPRLRLRDLVEASPARVVVVEADAGYGKTTAADELTADRPRLWYGLTAADRDPLVFVAHLAAALEELEVGSASERTSTRSWPVLLDRVINDLGRAGRPPTTLVFDDYHLVHGSPVDEVVVVLLERLPPDVRVLLTTRVRLLLPGWARGRALGDVLDVGRSALAFDVQETAQYFEASFGTSLSTAQATMLTEETEGWPIGLSLIGRQVREHRLNPEDVLAHLPEGRRQIFDFLGEQVFADQPEELRDFLLAVSGLQALDPDVCGAVAGIAPDRADEMLSVLSRGGVFCAGSDVGLFRLHHLFRDFLRAQLSSEERASLDERAAMHYRRRGLRETAARYALRTGSPSAAAQDVAAVAEHLVAAGRHLTLLDLSDPLGDALDEHPTVRVGRSHALRLTSRYREAVEEARRAAVGASGGLLMVARAAEAMVHLDTVAPAAAAPLLAAMLRQRRDPDPGTDDGHDLLVMLAEQHVNAGRLRLAGHALGRLAAAGRDDEVTRRIGVRYLARRGDLNRARAALEVAPLPGPTLVSHAHRENAALLSWVHGLLGHGDDAERHARVGIALGEELRSPILSCVCWGRVGLARLVRSPDDVSEAEESFRTALAIADGMAVPRFRAEPLIGLTLTAHRTGRPGETVRFGTEAVATLEAAGDRYLRAVATLALGIGLVRQGNPEADAWLDLARRRAGRVGDHYTVLLADQWSAWQALRSGDRDRFAAHAGAAVRTTARLALDDIWVTPPWLGLTSADERVEWLTAAQQLENGDRYSSYLLTRSAPRDRATDPSVGEPGSDGRVRIRTLGFFQVTRPDTGGSPAAWPRRKAMEILWLICASERHSLTREEVIARLWPDEPPEVAGLRFRVNLHALHLVLEPDRPQRSAPRVVRATADRLWLDPQRAYLDVDEFRTLAGVARQRTGTGAFEAALAAVDLYEGPFLVEALDQAWATGPREELATTFRDLVLGVSSDLIARREFGRAAALGRRLLEHDPYSEPAYRVVAAAHLAAGDRAAAERAHADCRHRLGTELGVEPTWTVDDL